MMFTGALDGLTPDQVDRRLRRFHYRDGGHCIGFWTRTASQEESAPCEE